MASEQTMIETFSFAVGKRAASGEQWLNAERVLLSTDLLVHPIRMAQAAT